jgi:hypothetical protein
MKIKIAENEAEISSCFDVLVELRPHLQAALLHVPQASAGRS